MSEKTNGLRPMRRTVLVRMVHDEGDYLCLSCRTAFGVIDGFSGDPAAVGFRRYGELKACPMCGARAVYVLDYEGEDGFGGWEATDE